MKSKNSNKNPLAIILIALVLLGGGYYFLSQKKTDVPNLPGGGETGTFSSIKDALSRSVSLECVYSDELGAKTTTYIKNGAIRINSEGGEGVEPGSAIVKDNKMYTWSDVTKEGFVIEMEDADTDETIGGPTSQGDKGAFINAIEQYRDNCKVTSVSDSHFTPPADIEFKDIASMFSGQNLPEGLEE